MFVTAKRRPIQLEETVIFLVEMGGSRFFFIESKSFELSISGWGAFPLQITCVPREGQRVAVALTQFLVQNFDS